MAELLKELNQKLS